MIFDTIFEPFIEQSAVSVMFRGTLEKVLAADRLDEIFRNTAQQQREGDLLFSTCADLLALVVAQSDKSINSAYRRRKKQGRIAVSVRSLYSKLAGIEPVVSQEMVSVTAADLKDVVRHMKASQAGPVPGYESRILDGNYLAPTQHRLKELRTSTARGLPGLALCVLNPQEDLIENVIVCEDGHANERRLTPQILQMVQEGQCWIADANFCTLSILFGIDDCDAFFIVRQHGQLQGKLQGRRRKIGRSATGVVYEQLLQLTYEKETLTVRRITVELDKPTQDGETQVHVLTNLPADDVSAIQVADAYLKRGKVETCFMELATALRNEIDTLCYPDAALFAFCLGLLLYNVMSVIRSALRVTHADSMQGRKFSAYYLMDELSGVYRGMMIAIGPMHWTAAFAHLSSAELAKVLLHLAKRVDPATFLTNKVRPNKPPPKRTPAKHGHHRSIHKILEQRKAAAKC